MSAVASTTGICTRRELLQLAAGGGLCAGALAGLGGPAVATSAATVAPRLRDLAAAGGRFYGAATGRRQLEADPDFARCFAAECGLLVPENELKWRALRPAPDQFDFSGADWLVAFARRQGLLVRGHTLVWHDALAPWLQTVRRARDAEQLLGAHIAAVVGRYAGQMHSWDVVNEVINPEDGRADGLRASFWHARLDSAYIELAFHQAAAADPAARLVLNETQIEYDDDASARRRDHLLALLQRLLAKGVPVHALGVQSHLVGHVASDFHALADFLDEVERLGLRLIVTELDVRDWELPAEPAARDAAVAAVYADYLAMMLPRPNLDGVVTWGLSDRYTWLSEYGARADGAPVRPLPFDHACQRKLAWSAISTALQTVANKTRT